MNYIKVNTVALRRTAQEMQRISADTDRQVSDITEKIQSLNAMWEGPAKMIYVSNVQKSREDFDAVCQQIKKAAAEMETAAASYERCESSIENEIRNIRM